jgi:hypothetical protein
MTRMLHRLCGPLAFTIGATATLLLPPLRPDAFRAVFLAGEAVFVLGIVLVTIGAGIEEWRLPRVLLGPSVPRLRPLRQAVAGSDVVLGGVLLLLGGALLHPVVLLAAPRLGMTGAGRAPRPLMTVMAACLAGAPLLMCMLRRRRTAGPSTS